jgi:hypothetical protein
MTHELTTYKGLQVVTPEPDGSLAAAVNDNFHSIADALSGLGTAASEDVGTSAGNVLQLDSNAKLPAVDGSQLQNLPVSSIPPVMVEAATASAVDTSSLAYDNGTNGVGATLTGTVNTMVSIDGIDFNTVGMLLLVKDDSRGHGTDETIGYVNGVYVLTQLQTSTLPPVFTRHMDYDAPEDFRNSAAIQVTYWGNVNSETSWCVLAYLNISSVGTDGIFYRQFSYAPIDIVTVQDPTSQVRIPNPLSNNGKVLGVTADNGSLGWVTGGGGGAWGSITGTLANQSDLVTALNAGLPSYSNTASGTNSHAEGTSTTASGSAAHAEGESTSASGAYSHAEGFSSTASGDFAHAQGESCLASGSGAHAEGQGATASGSNSHAEGQSSTASGTAAHAEGVSTTASGVAAHGEGQQSQATAPMSHASGYGALAGRYGEVAHASGFFSNVGDAQAVTLLLRGSGTTVELFLDGSAQRILFDPMSCWTFTVHLAGLCGAGTQYGGYWCGSINTITGTTPAVSLNQIWNNTGNTGLTVTGNSDGSVSFTASSGGSDTCNWVARVEAVQVTTSSTPHYFASPKHKVTVPDIDVPMEYVTAEATEGVSEEAPMSKIWEAV